ncbi:MAG: PD-(D/E)XK nuclease family protein [bacterium]
MRLSYSALDTFKLCPAKYKFQYIDKIKVPKSGDAIFGTLIHSALKHFHDPGRPFSPTEEDLLSFWSQNWQPDIFPDPRQEAAAFAQGVQILKNYFAKNSGQQFDILALETPFEVPMSIGQETHFITGKIDRIDKIENDAFEVIDYKTTKKMPAQKNVDTDLQLSLYHLGLANRWPKIKEEDRPVKVSLYYLKHGEKLSSLRSANDLTQTQEGAIGMLEKIKKAHSEEKFPPVPNPLCDWCAYQRWCPLFKHKFKEEKIIFNDQDVKALIGEYFQLKDEIDERDKKIGQIKSDFSKFMDQEGLERLFGDDGYITRQTIQRFKYDWQMIKDILEPLGRLNDVLKLDEIKLKKVIKELPPDLRQKAEKAKKIHKEFKALTPTKNKRSKN